MQFDETKFYVIDGRSLNYIASLVQWLYEHDSSSVGADEARTMADGLNAHLNAVDRYYNELSPQQETHGDDGQGDELIGPFVAELKKIINDK